MNTSHLPMCDVCQSYWAEHRCSACKQRRYCSGECQQRDWLENRHYTKCSKELIGEVALIGEFVSGTDRRTGASIRRATAERSGSSRVVKLVVDVVTERSEEPAPGSLNIEWMQIRRPPGADPNGRYWRAEVTQQSIRVRLKDTGPVQALSAANDVEVQDEIQPEELDTIIAPRPPQKGEYRFYFIREVRITFDTDKPATVRNNQPVVDTRFTIYKKDEAADNFALWANRKETLKEGYIGRLDVTIFDPNARRDKVLDPALRNATRNRRRGGTQEQRTQPLADEL